MTGSFPAKTTYYSLSIISDYWTSLSFTNYNQNRVLSSYSFIHVFTSWPTTLTEDESTPSDLTASERSNPDAKKKISASLNLVNLRQLPFSPTNRRKDRTGYCFQREARPTFNVDCNYQEQAKTMSLPPSFVVATAQQTTTSQRINGAHWKCAESLRS